MARILVLGGGFAGLGAAHRLGRRGHEVTILERGQTLGGAVASYVRPGYTIEKYYHHFFRHDTEILALIRELGMESRVMWRTTLTGYQVEGRVYPLNTPREVLRYPHLSLREKWAIYRMLRFSRTCDMEEFNNVSVREFLERYPPGVYGHFFEPLMRSKFGDAERVSAAWLLSRIRQRSARNMKGEVLGYLRGGFHPLTQELVRRVQARFETGCTVTGLRREEGQMVARTSSGEFRGDAILSTVPTDVLNRLWGQPVTPEILYQGAACFLLSLSEPLLDDIYWLNLKDPGPIGALIEHTNFAPLGDYGEHLVYAASYIQDKSDPRWTAPPEKLEAQYLEALHRLFPRSRQAITRIELARDWYVGPVYTLGYRPLPYSTPVPGLYQAGFMSAPNFPERSISGSLQAGREAAIEMEKHLASAKSP